MDIKLWSFSCTMDLVHLLLPSVVVSLSFLLFLLRIIKRGSSSSKPGSLSNLPPGPRKLPFIGSIHHLLTKLPHQAFHCLAREHGPVMLVRLGQINVLVISSPEAAREIMKTKDLNFCTRPEFPVQNVITYGCTNVALAPYGPYWRQVKKICTVELLSTIRVRSFLPHFDEEITKVVTDISTSGEKLVNLSRVIPALLSSIIARCAFGAKSKHHEKFIPALKEIIILMSGFCVADFFPNLKLMDVLSGIGHRVDKVHRSLDEIFEGIIQEHQLKHAKGVEEVEDIVDVLLRIKEEGELDIQLTLDNIKAVILDLFSAGTETSSTTFLWAMSEMMKKPRIMKKAQEEIRWVMKGKTKIEESDLGEFHYLKLIIKETLRLHPPFPLLLPRQSIDACQVAGYNIPAKTKVFVNVWAIGRDPQYWDDAENFKPERFCGSQVDFRGTNFELVPFGAGRRICPGITFASTTMELTLASFLFYFNWELPNQLMPRQIDMTESFGIATARKTDLCLLATPYSSAASV